MKNLILLIEISSSSILLFAGILFLTNRKNKNVGLLFLGMFLGLLGIHHLSLIVLRFFFADYVHLLEEYHVFSFFLHAYISLQFLISFHYRENQSRIRPRTLLSYLSLLIPSIVLISMKEYSVNLNWLVETTGIGGCLLVSSYGLLMTFKSDLEASGKRFLGHIHLSFLLMNLVWLGVILSRYIAGINVSVILLIFLVSELYLTYGIILIVLRNPETIFEKEYLRDRIPGFQPGEKYQGSRLSQKEAEGIGKKILQEMESQQLFLNPDLTIDALASHLQLSPRIVSQVINTELKTNFSDLMNAYRLEEAKRLLQIHSNQEMNISQVMYQSGFSSKSSFNSYFKRKLSMTPTQYRKQWKREKAPWVEGPNIS